MATAGAQEAVLTLRTPAADLAGLYPWLEAAAEARQVPQAVRHAMHVALEEAVANVAMHAFAPDEPGRISVSLHAAPDAVALVVEDSGRPFDQATAPGRARAASLDVAAPGGLGLTLLRHFCRDLSYQRVEAGNRLTLRFPLAAS
jgi:anti-sigma regulatory factor (Ser/Thr protein kinase)